MTNEQAIAAWNNNEPVTVIELGGLGAAYEQGIYVMAFAFLAALLAQPVDFKKPNERCAEIEAQPEIDALITKVGPSGAMVGAAWNAAFVFARQGYEQGLSMAPDRQIVVQKNTPRNYE